MLAAERIKQGNIKLKTNPELNSAENMSNVGYVPGNTQNDINSEWSNIELELIQKLDDGYSKHLVKVKHAMGYLSIS